MFLDFLEKRSEEVDDTPQLTDEEKLFLKVFGIEEDQPAAAMKEATYFTCIKKLWRKRRYILPRTRKQAKEGQKNTRYMNF